MPVALPPDRAKLATRPVLTGSVSTLKTNGIGIVAVASLAAAATRLLLSVTMTATRRWTRWPSAPVADRIGRPASGTRLLHFVPRRSKFRGGPRGKQPRRPLRQWPTWQRRTPDHRQRRLLSRRSKRPRRRSTDPGDKLAPPHQHALSIWTIYRSRVTWGTNKKRAETPFWPHSDGSSALGISGPAEVVPVRASIGIGTRRCQSSSSSGVYCGASVRPHLARAGADVSGLRRCVPRDRGAVCFGLRRHLLRAAVDGPRTAGYRPRCRRVRFVDAGVGVVVGQSMMTPVARGPITPLATRSSFASLPAQRGERVRSSGSAIAQPYVP